MKKQLVAISFFIGVFLVSLLFYRYGVLDGWQDKVVDHLFIKEKPKQQIVIISIDDESLNSIGNWPWSRMTFAKIIPTLQKAKVIGFDINFADPSSKGEADDLSLETALKNSKAPVIFPLELRKDGEISVKPLSRFEQYVQEGFANVQIDQDGVGRRIGYIQSQYKSLPALLTGVSEQSQGRIHYSGPSQTFVTIPFIDVYNGKIPENIFDGSIVLIGATANDLHDFVETPFGLMPGVEVLANSAETILNNNFVYDFGFVFSLLSIFVFDCLVFLSITRIKKLALLISSLLITFVLILFSTFIFFYFNQIFPIVYVFVSSVLMTACMLTFQYSAESKEKKFIRSTFQYYLAADVIEQLVTNPEKLRLGGEKRKVSILFSDVRDFTTISESMTPEKLTSFMSEYFTKVSDIVMDRRGVIDKYIGDAIMAFWGAPLDNPQHPEDACRVALEIVDTLEEHNKLLKEQGLPVISTGIGINTGEVVVGNMGSKKRFNYTIVGDDVNFTSRLEGLTKEYGVGCIISETTKDEIKHIPDMYVRELDEVLVKGKKKPKRIYQLMKKPTDEKIIQKFSSFEEGRKLYVEGKWPEAITCFERALTFGEDKSSKMFIERCHALIANPPIEWTGVYQFKTK